MKAPRDPDTQESSSCLQEGWTIKSRPVQDWDSDPVKGIRPSSEEHTALWWPNNNKTLRSQDQAVL